MRKVTILISAAVLVIIFFITGLVVGSRAYDHFAKLQNGEAKIETVVVSDFDIHYYGRKLYEAEAEANLNGEKVKII